MRDLKGVGLVATVGLDMVLSIVVGTAGGWWLDGKLKTGGWLTGIGFLFGVAAGFNNLYKAAKRLNRHYEQEDGKRGPDETRDDAGNGNKQG